MRWPRTVALISLTSLSGPDGPGSGQVWAEQRGADPMRGHPHLTAPSPLRAG